MNPRNIFRYPTVFKTAALSRAQPPLQRLEIFEGFRIDSIVRRGDGALKALNKKEVECAPNTRIAFTGGDVNGAHGGIRTRTSGF